MTPYTPRNAIASLRCLSLAALLGVTAVGCQLDWNLAEDPTTPPDCVRYVSESADPGIADGLTWETAYRTPQDAIDAAASQSTSRSSCEVWVTRGTYNIYQTGPTDTLRLALKVAVYGGFVGDETARSQRDWANSESILDGRASGSGDDRVYHVVTGANDAILDGFTITHGRADGTDASHQSGAGMRNDTASPTVRNCIFTQNEAAQSGGAVVNIGGTPKLINCQFLDNEASSGGAIHNRNAAVELTSCVFRGNFAHQRGGGLASSASATVRIRHSLFVDNRADQAGGAIFNVDDAFTTVTSSILWNNRVGDDKNSIANSAELIVSYSVVQHGHPGEGNLDRNPKFVNADHGDYRLKNSSPCIDAGDGSQAPTTDLEGNPRVDDPNTENTGIGVPDYVDIGAFEYQPEANEGGDDE